MYVRIIQILDSFRVLVIDNKINVYEVHISVLKFAYQNEFGLAWYRIEV